MRVLFSSLRHATRLACLLGFLLWMPRAAEAQGVSPGYYLPMGLTASTALHRTGKVGGFLGGEMSFVYFNEYWYGGYFDAGYDFGIKRSRISLGPEFGFEYYGADAGLLLEQQPTGWGKGFVVRGVASMAVVAIYARYGQILTGDQDIFFETGILLKWPIHLM
jgi:hypothetical protein